MLTFTLIIIVAYLFGSISTAVIVCRSMGLPDPRTQGSHNPGATNVLRYGGKKAGIATLAGDIIKGVTPVLAVRLISDDPQYLAVAAAAAFLGHMFPVFFGFRGGKGVATAFGVLLGCNWIIALSVLGIWLLTVVVSKISSLGAITAALFLPLVTWFVDDKIEYMVLSGFITVLLLIRHHSNIHNLITGKEDKIKAGTKEHPKENET